MARARMHVCSERRRICELYLGDSVYGMTQSRLRAQDLLRDRQEAERAGGSLGVSVSVPRACAGMSGVVPGRIGGL